jgi:hypothetical protein
VAGVTLQYRRQHIVKADRTLEETGEIAAARVVGGRGRPLTPAAAAGVHGIAAHYGVGGGEDAVGGLVWRRRYSPRWFSAARVAGHAIWVTPGLPRARRSTVGE